MAENQKLPVAGVLQEQDSLMISLFDGFLPKIANEDGLWSMQKNALARGHPRKCQPARSTLIAYGVRMNPWTPPEES